MVLVCRLGTVLDKDASGSKPGPHDRSEDTSAANLGRELGPVVSGQESVGLYQSQVTHKYSQVRAVPGLQLPGQSQG